MGQLRGAGQRIIGAAFADEQYPGGVHTGNEFARGGGDVGEDGFGGAW